MAGGVTIDSPAINAAIDAAAPEGGGVVYLPAGRYASYSVRLASHVHFYLEKGCVLLAAEPSATQGYDMAEDFEWGPEYQDYGHSHWKNSLIWGIGLENISDADTRPVLVTDDVQGLRLNNITVDGRDVTDEIRNR